ncbi:hypothetical protein CDAR_457491 [Caerostris darwini]|uniref:Uncharacterized protein n=1 Tax=Caerostris darwini TaxID=1538125 RepID=A0AAV4PXN3_9ARAC|nr:hypothetical protein CDAR_457491 [Caerostris darwini]
MQCVYYFLIDCTKAYLLNPIYVQLKNIKHCPRSIFIFRMNELQFLMRWLPESGRIIVTHDFLIPHEEKGCRCLERLDFYLLILGRYFIFLNGKIDGAIP